LLAVEVNGGLVDGVLGVFGGGGEWWPGGRDGVFGV